MSSIKNKKVKLSPRVYQKEAVEKIMKAHKTDKSRIVLSAATGSGKTEMSIMIIDDFIKTHPSEKVLVITHHTNVIKDNFVSRLDEIKPDFSYSTTDKSADVFVCIRQNIVDLNMDDYSLLVVDEAHHNYFSYTVQSRIKGLKHQVLLTATPSKFVRKGGYDIIPIGRLDIPNEYFANLSCICVNSDNDVTHDDLNDDGVLLSKYNFKKDEMEKVVSSVIPHLKEGKKLFIFRNIKDAKKGSLVLKNKFNITAPVSDSKSDPDGVLVDRFKNNGLDNLCVVDRMRLGYSDNFLYYTIDLTFTHNPDSLYQIMSRSNRGNQSMNKYYIKTTNDRLNEYTRVIISVALSLFKSENIVRYNGRNFKGMNIPVLKRSISKGHANSSRDQISSVILPNVLDDVINFFENADYVEGDYIIRTLLNKTESWTKEKVFEISDGLTKKLFKSKFVGAYNHSIRNGYYHELNLLGYRINWTRSKVISVSKGLTKRQFIKKYRHAYEHAKNNGYYNKLKLEGLNVWTKEKVIEVSKGLTKSQFKAKYGGAYHHSKNNGYYDELNLGGFKTWTKEKVIKVSKGLTKEQFRLKHGGAYSHSINNKYHNELDFVKGVRGPKKRHLKLSEA
jgi:hypothetical protein